MSTFNALELVAEIVAAFVQHNSLAMRELPGLIESVHAVVKTFAGAEVSAATIVDPPTPAVPVHKSVTSDYLICLEDGKRFKSMRRHLTRLGMTPELYRAKWGLPSTYPMVAATYAAQRSATAKSIGFGRRWEKPAVTVAATGGKAQGGIASPSKAPAKRKAGRPRKPMT